MKHFTIILLLVSAGTVNAQTTVIPDPAFEQELINLGLDGAIDGQVLTANINTVTILDVGFKNISDLTGIEDFTALDTLICYSNQITSLNVTQNTTLSYLDCSINKLTNLDVTQNTFLSYLDCFFNQLTSLNVNQNSALTYLSCMDNDLINLDLSGATALTYLHCRGNQLTSLDVTQNTALDTLMCYSNQITNLDVTQNTALYRLSCLDNQLTNLDVTQNTALTSLSCRDNQITNLDVSQNIALTSLSCPINQLINLDVTQNTALTNLYCYQNQLTNLNVTQNPALIHLECQDNQLNCLNIKNGYNINFWSFAAYNNPNLTCIEVDDVVFSTTYMTNIDPQTSFSTNCPNPCLVGIDEHSLTNFSLYPNPTKEFVTIEMEGVKKQEYYLYSIIGELVESGTIASDNNTINVADLPANVYLLKIGNSTSKLIIAK